jgi:hypothetical protein
MKTFTALNFRKIVVKATFATFRIMSIGEIREALNSMKKWKSPGPDGLSVEFYRQFWELREVALDKSVC